MKKTRGKRTTFSKSPPSDLHLWKPRRVIMMESNFPRSWSRETFFHPHALVTVKITTGFMHQKLYIGLRKHTHSRTFIHDKETQVGSITANLLTNNHIYYHQMSIKKRKQSRTLSFLKRDSFIDRSIDFSLRKEEEEGILRRNDRERERERERERKTESFCSARDKRLGHLFQHLRIKSSSTNHGPSLVNDVFMPLGLYSRFDPQTSS
jgi:hypothetical protein